MIIAVSAGLVSGMVYALTGISIGLLRQTSHYYNLAQAAEVTFAAYCAYIVAEHSNSLILIALAAIAAGLVGGLAVYFLLRKLIAASTILPALVVTISLATLIEETMRVTVNGGLPVALPAGIATSGANLIRLGKFSGFWALVAVIVIVALFTRWLNISRTGLAIRAVGWSREAALSNGVQVGKIDLFVAGVSGVFTGAAGLLVMFLYGSISPYALDPILFVSISSILVAGSGNVVGIAAIGLILGLIDGVASYFAYASDTELISLVIIIVILLGRPMLIRLPGMGWLDSKGT